MGLASLSTLFGAAALASSAMFVAPTGARAAITEQEARAIAIDAYLYFYPLVAMDITRKVTTNVEAGKIPGFGPPNTFNSFAEFPAADFKTVVRANFDTLYSVAAVDLTKEPMIVSAPDTQGRYYLLPMLDAWTDVFASPGWRTTGTAAADFLVTPPGWRGTVPAGMTRISAPTPDVWIIGRTKTDGPQDYDAVHRIQAGYKITPLSAWGQPSRPVEAKVDPSVDMKTPPKDQIDKMPADKFFAYAAEIMKINPPHDTDQPMIAQLRKIGIEPGKSFDIAKLDPAIRLALTSAPADAQKLMTWKLPTMARVENGWSMNTDTMGVYGNYYLKRAIIAQQGLGANLPEDAIYPINLADDTGRRSTAQANTRSISIRARRRRRAPSGRSRSTIRMASRSRTRSTASPSAAGCRSNPTPTARSTSTFRAAVRVRRRNPIGCRRRRARSI